MCLINYNAVLKSKIVIPCWLIGKHWKHIQSGFVARKDIRSGENSCTIFTIPFRPWNTMKWCISIPDKLLSLPRIIDIQRGTLKILLSGFAFLRDIQHNRNWLLSNSWPGLAGFRGAIVGSPSFGCEDFLKLFVED